MVSPWAWRFRSSVTVEMGLRPAFSASVYGMTSRASAKALKQYASAPTRVLAYSISFRYNSVSGAPPPAMRYFFFTRHLMTQSASCRDLSASSSMSLFEPRRMRDTVRPWVAAPVNLMYLDTPTCCSSIRSTLTRFSAVKWSREAIGRHPMVLQTWSMSSRSISLTTMIFILSKKCTAKSERASRRMDFWMSRTLQPAFLICLTMLRM